MSSPRCCPEVQGGGCLGTRIGPRLRVAVHRAKVDALKALLVEVLNRSLATLVL
jgi:hypothetical protein